MSHRAKPVKEFHTIGCNDLHRDAEKALRPHEHLENLLMGKNMVSTERDLQVLKRACLIFCECCKSVSDRRTYGYLCVPDKQA